MDFTFMKVYIGILYAVVLCALIYFVYKIVKDIKNKKNTLKNSDNAELFDKDNIIGELAATTNDNKQFIEIDDNTIVMRKSEFVSFSENYEELSDEQKSFVVDIIDYAKSISDKTKEIKNEKGITVSLGSYKLVKIVIKKGDVVAKMLVPNVELANYVENSGVNFREKPIDIIVDNEEMKKYVCDLIDLTYSNINQIKADRQKSRREKKRKRLIAG